MCTLFLHKSMQPSLAVQLNILQNLSKIHQRRVNRFGLLPLIEILKFVAFGQRTCKVALVLNADKIIIPFAFLAAPHMSIVIIGRIFLALASNECFKVELMYINGL